MTSRKITLKIIPYKNPGGTLAFRVSGMIYGERIQKNFPTQAEAEVFMHGLVAAANQGESSPARIAPTTFATDADLREAELAFHRLRAKIPDGSLISAVDHYLARATRAGGDIGAAEAIDDFLARRRGRGNRDNTVRGTAAVLRAFVRTAPIRRISEFTPARAEAFIFDEKISVRTRRDRRDLLHNWAEFLVGQNLLAVNFVAAIERPKVERHGAVTILTVAQGRRLLDAAATEPAGRKKARGAMLPYFAIGLLSGIRPEECKRLGEDWAQFSFENKIISGFKPKTRRPRTVEIHDNLLAILRQCRERGLAPGFFSKKAFDRIRAVAGVAGAWHNDLMRHTFASHHYAWKRDIGHLVKNMGNSEDVLRQSYLNETVLAAEGEALFKITPVLGSN